MSEPTDRVAEPGEINQAIELFCDEHRAQFAGRNMIAVQFGFMQEFIKRVELPPEKPAEDDRAGHEAVSFAFLKAIEPRKAMCCMLTVEQRAEVLAKSPPTTGDAVKDEDAAQMLYHGVVSKERHYPPKPASYTKSSEGGKDYYMMLSEPYDSMPPEFRSAKKKAAGWRAGDMVAILSEGHPNHPRGPDDTCTVLHVAKASTVKEARKKFRKWLDEKDWLKSGDDYVELKPS